MATEIRCKYLHYTFWEELSKTDPWWRREGITPEGRAMIQARIDNAQKNERSLTKVDSDITKTHLQ